MNNPITNWSFDKPTEPGMYLACYGDIEVVENIFYMTLYEAANTTLSVEGLVDQDGNDIDSYGPSWKFAKLVIGGQK